MGFVRPWEAPDKEVVLSLSDYDPWSEVEIVRV
jgi:hypothetical protein